MAAQEIAVKVLQVYQRRDPGRPLVCLDQTSKQLIAETRVPQARGTLRIPLHTSAGLSRRLTPAGASGRSAKTWQLARLILSLSKVC
jgi:hypothetical protein